MRPYDLVTLLQRVSEARLHAEDAMEACLDPRDIIDEETFAQALRDAGLDTDGIVGIGDPVYMMRMPMLLSVEVRAYTLCSQGEITDEDARWLTETYLRMDVLRIFFEGIARLARQKNREMHGCK